MYEFPIYSEVVKIRDIEFEIMDLTVGFIDRVEKNPELYSEKSVVLDGSTLTESQISNLRNREISAISERILDLNNPERNKISEDNEGVKK